MRSVRNLVLLLLLPFFAISCKIDDGNDSTLSFNAIRTIYNYNVETMNRVSRSLEFMPLASDYIFGTEEERTSLEKGLLKGYKISNAGSNRWCFSLNNRASYVIEHDGTEYSILGSKWLVDYVDGYKYIASISGNTQIEIVCLDGNNKGVQGDVVNIGDESSTSIFRLNITVNADVKQGVYVFEGNSVMSMYNEDGHVSYEHKYTDCETSIEISDQNLIDGDIDIIIKGGINDQKVAEIEVLSSKIIITFLGEELSFNKSDILF